MGFWSILEPKIPPKTPYLGAPNPHLGAKIGPRASKVGAKIGSKPQLGARMAPRPSQDTSRDRFWRILASILDVFLMIFQGFWWSFLLLSLFVLASILLPFCIHILKILGPNLVDFLEQPQQQQQQQGHQSEGRRCLAEGSSIAMKQRQYSYWYWYWMDEWWMDK